MTREQQILHSILVQQGTVILCFRCNAPLVAEVPTQKEHFHERALGGPDIWENWNWSHKDCHAVATFGSGASTANSSIGKIAKERRIIRTQKFAVVKSPPSHCQSAEEMAVRVAALTQARNDEKRAKRSWPSRKMQSRKFGKRTKS